MTDYRVLMGVLLLICIPTGVAYATTTPLVDAAWLLENHSKSGLRVLDLQHPRGYGRAHIPGSVNTDYGKWRVRGPSGVPAMLPNKEYLEDLIGNLGIGNNTHVILAPLGAGAGDMAVATRIYWTFKAMGHDRISILDGGLIEYSRTPGVRFVSEAVQPEPAKFTAQVRASYSPDAMEVKAALDQHVTFVDSRSKKEFIGKVSGGKRERPGTIPGAIPLPFDRLVVKGTGRFHSLERLREIYSQSGVPLEGDQISFCHTGHRTSLSWFVSHELLGNSQARMYDGSTVEWATDPELPLVVLGESGCNDRNC